jgi:hypothetical protein
MMQALELETKTDENGALRIQLSQQYRNRKFKVILLSADEEEEWLQAISKNPAFDFLKEPQEDIYSLNDGKPFYE